MREFLDDQWLVEQLKEAELAFKAGDKSRILHGVQLCTVFGLDRRSWPEWLDRAFNDAYEAGLSGSIRSWDDVFGKPVAKGKQGKAQRRRQELTLPIVHRVEQLRAEGSKIDKGLFEKVGREFGVGATTADKVYYSEGGQFLRDTLRRKFSTKS
jgi:hypothetical protein